MVVGDVEGFVGVVGHVAIGIVVVVNGIVGVVETTDFVT